MSIIQQQHSLNVIKDLPEDKLVEVADFVTFLREKYQPRHKKKIVKLEGLWEGLEASDEEIQKVRKEIWEHLETKKIL